MRDVRGGDAIGDGGYGFGGGGGGWAWWGFAFIIFIIFAILMIFAWMRGGQRDGGFEKFLPLLGMLGLGKHGHGDDCGCKHTEIIKDQAKDTGAIIHNADMRAYDLKASQDSNTYRLERRIDEMESGQKDTKINDLRAELMEEKTSNKIGYAFGDLKREVLGIKEHFKPGWFEPAYSKCG